MLEELLRKALERIAELESKLSKNSSNSSKPPSSDQKGNTPNDKEGKKRPAHAGKARAPYPPEQIDQHIQCERQYCPHSNSKNLERLDKPFIWQQAELPVVKAIITQFNCFKYLCKSCGERSVAELPQGVPLSAFGPKLMAFVACLTGRFHLAKREAITLVKDLYGVDKVLRRSGKVLLPQRASSVYPRIPGNLTLKGKKPSFRNGQENA